MKTKHHWPTLSLLAALSVLEMACGDSPGGSPLPGELSAAGAGAAAPLHWSGIQSCRGAVDGKDVGTSSDEASIDDYTKTATRVNILGVHIGPSAEYACGPLDLAGAVTMNSPTTHFENNAQQSCSSSTGRPLLVDHFDGYDIDSRTHTGVPLGDLSLQFTVDLHEPQEDGGVSDRTLIRCSFDLTLK